MNTQSQNRFPDCGGSLLNFISDCNQVYDGSLESDQILNRGQLTRKRVSVDTSCCRNHKVVMGKYFHILDSTHNKTKCQSPLHVGKNKFLKIGTSTTLREMGLEKSQTLLKKECRDNDGFTFNIAYRDWICRDCDKEVDRFIRETPEPTSDHDEYQQDLRGESEELLGGSEEVAGDSEDLLAGLNIDGERKDESGSESSQSISGSQKKKEESKKEAPTMAALNKFLTDSGYPALGKHLESDFDKVSPQYQGNFKRAMADAIVAASRAMTSEPENYDKVLKATLKSNRIEKGKEDRYRKSRFIDLYPFKK